jgi:hypothetical protein
MQFKHCGVHHQEFDSLVRSARSVRGTSGFPIVLGCRRCHQWYFSDLAPAEMPPELARILVKAERVLAEECPDHPHRFEVERVKGR